MAATPLIAADNVTFRYRPGNLALDGATLAIPAGSRVALVGPNGAGKSTLFLHINAILRPVAGQLSYKGQPYSYGRGFLAALRQKVGLVFQDPDTQLFAGNVLDDVIFGPMNMGLTAEEARRRAEAALESVGMLEHRTAPVHFLSQGQKKRVAIAGVLAMEPEALVMDEPTAGLDYPGLTSLRETLAMLHAAGKTLLVATHDIDWAWNWADLVYVLAAGRMVAAGSPADILARADHAALGFARPILADVAAALGDRSILPAGVVPRSVGELAALLAGRQNGQK
ncbi:energy-coupling factor ABC transporter ATP-binding protein [Anaeroselena agilis]|uniref:ABC transporter ATP-binding protein n=1 Tax=Anaeroselena agilis TaxID=3063788 RepID=A0ABU3P3B4_9FIRM|nr:ATP-binding cassette domain-containing protein [Selenomonadales bacterium 4137-cl]